MDWCVLPPDKANHAPIAGFNGTPGQQAIHLSAPPGQIVDLNAAGSSDPDGDSLTYQWTVYRDPGTCPLDAPIDHADQPHRLARPRGHTAGQTIHVVLSVTDDRSPPLTAYRRIVVTIGDHAIKQRRDAGDDEGGG